MNNLVLLLILFAATACHHAGDFFRYRKTPVESAGAGVQFYDWWRAQQGANIVSYPQWDHCLVLHMLGFEMGRLPGRFCLLLPGGRYFSLDKQAVLYGDRHIPIWQWTPRSPVRDVRWFVDGIWFLMEDGETAEIQKWNLVDKVPQFTWRGKKTEAPAGSLQPFDKHVLSNGNTLELGDNVIERNDEGRVVWQWRSTETGTAPWVERVEEYLAADYLKSWQRP
jgi:hypothetical protein